MKYIAGMIVVLMSNIAFAQQGGRHGDRSEHLRKDLQLDEKQFATVKSVDEKFGIAINELRQDQSLSKEVKHEKAQALQQRRIDEISAVLTPEQKSKWDQQRKEHQEKKKEFKKQKKEDIEALGLTPDQKNKFKEEQRSFKESSMALKHEQKLSDSDAKVKRRALKESHKANLKKILTDVQYAKWESMKGEGHKKHHR
jgi:hypothetical protein